jgi:hypothetical protein
MAVLSTVFPTILDVVKGMDPTGRQAKVAEVLQEYHDFLDDIPWIEGNQSSGHLSVVRTSLPAGTWRSLNRGITATHPAVGQIENTCGRLESLSHVDVAIAEMANDVNTFRFNQDKAFIQGMGNDLMDTMIYGNVSINPERFEGLAQRYASLGTTYTTSAQILDAGGVGSDNTSIWLVAWDTDRCYGIYPKGGKGGLDSMNDGLITITDPNNSGNFMKVYQSHYVWRAGIAVDDYRSVVRICNIDVSALLTASDGSDTSANIIKYMSRALDLLPPGFTNGRIAFYMTRQTRGLLRVKMNDKSNLFLQVEHLVSPSGITRRPTLTFQGVPCRVSDAILHTEDSISTSTVPT